ncbi:MAG: rRNA maturation RNase YbeY [Flavobacteriales bacterium]|jgi:rRNA maturation RNase YbeY|nr:rRNA maturation RNase YbeY [Flavobacteriales bacterium]
MSVSFVSERISFECPNQELLEKWLSEVCSTEKKRLEHLTYIFCADDYLLKINQKYLQHDYYTDVITFDNSENTSISGDVFISIDRVKENASGISVPFGDELHRVMVHGLLHLIGFNDKTERQKSDMTSREDFYLSLRPF